MPNRENAARHRALSACLSGHVRTATTYGIALGIAVAVGTAVVLGVSAALDATWDPRGSVLLAIAAVWIPQALISAARHRRH